MDKAGLPYTPVTEYAKLDRARAQRVAREFERMQHNPADPDTAAAYAAMIRETLAQYQAVKETGLKVEFMKPGMADPYEPAGPRAAILDVVNNNHLWVYPTDFGFGSDATFDAKDNPLLAVTDEVIDGKRARANDIFRIVHDYFGHVKDGVGFRAEGEENAWRSHSSMYSPLARKAMTTETRGQNSWLNFGPNGERNRTAKTADTVFADQKVGLLPDWVVSDGATDQAQPAARERVVMSGKPRLMAHVIPADLTIEVNVDAGGASQTVEMNAREAFKKTRRNVKRMEALRRCMG